MPDRPRVHPARVAAPAAAAAQLVDARVADLAGAQAIAHPSVRTAAGFRGTNFRLRLAAVPSTRALIHAPWSASKVSTALRCPRLFHFKYVQKIKEPEVMPEARIGKAIHKALELVLHGHADRRGDRRVRAELPSETEQLRFDALAHRASRAFATRIAQFRRRRRVARQLVEYSLAVREDLTTTQFYAGDAYYRGVLDLGYLFEDDSLALVDHKTGARIPGTSIADQLEGYAVLAAAAFRHVRTFWLGIHWIAERAVEWSAPVHARDDHRRARARPARQHRGRGARGRRRPARRTRARGAIAAAIATCARRAASMRYEPVEYYEDDED